MLDKVEVFKALSDYKRLLIIEMLSCGKLCACDLYAGLNLTQPTISHHMKILQQAGLVKAKKNGKWVNYSLCKEAFNEVCSFIQFLSTDKEDCICKTIKKEICN
ncbi:MAG: winged helix-turn-helix transcriptional regulator [Alkaliphilus sp.]|nr:winged helix-turn-helix transcriptional regulator [Alkaliphilus sp.]